MNKIFVTIKKEVRATLRDKKSLMMMLCTPLLIPVFIFFFSYFYDTLLDDNNVNYYNIGTNYVLNNVEKELFKELNLKEYYGNTDTLSSMYDTKKIDAYIIYDGINNYEIVMNKQNTNSLNAYSKISMYLENYKDYLINQIMQNNGIDVNSTNELIKYKETNTSSQSDFVDQLILFGFIFAIMSITLSAIYSSIDSTAGEKEKGTLETLLTFPVSIVSLLIGKYMAVVISCVITSIIGIILTVLSLNVASGIFNIFEGINIVFSFKAIILVLLIMVIYSFFISGVSMLISSFSKSYKEAQSALTPISLFVMVPMFLEILSVKTNSILSLIPIVNHTLLLNDVFKGTINVGNLLLMILSSLVYIVLIFIFIKKVYKSENILFKN